MAVKNIPVRVCAPDRLFPVQQPLLAFQFTDLGQIQANLQASAVVSVGIAYRKVSNVDEFAAQFDPEFGRIP